MKLLITGASGFTGHYLVKSAQAISYEVVESTVDLKDSNAVKMFVTEVKPDAVVHLAAISFVGHQDVQAFYSVNVIGTMNLLDALASLSTPPKVLLASSANVYGNCDVSPIAEDQMPVPINHYAMSKLAMEYMAKNYLNKLPLFFVRPFNYTGHGQAISFIIPKLIEHFAQRKKSIDLGNLDVEREFNDVRFVCEAYLRLLQLGKPGEIYNICSGQAVALNSIIHLISELSGHQLEVNINPAFVRKNEVYRLYGNPQKLISEVGLIQSPALKETLHWMLESRLREIQH